MKRILSIILVAVLTIACGSHNSDKKSTTFTNDQFKTADCPQGMKINATFLDEISWDIPHQNWGVEEWDQDFRAMKDMGINLLWFPHIFMA